MLDGLNVIGVIAWNGFLNIHSFLWSFLSLSAYTRLSGLCC
jgi:hypothetical protein